MSAKDLRTIPQLCEERPYLTQPAVRWYVQRAEQNGLAAKGAIKRMGRRVLIDLALYDEWVEDQAAQPVPQRRAAAG